MNWLMLSKLLSCLVIGPSHDPNACSRTVANLTKTSDMQGIALGLNLVSAIADLHQAKLAYTSIATRVSTERAVDIPVRTCTLRFMTRPVSAALSIPPL